MPSPSKRQSGERNGSKGCRGEALVTNLLEDVFSELRLYQMYANFGFAAFSEVPHGPGPTPIEDV